MSIDNKFDEPLSEKESKEIEKFLNCRFLEIIKNSGIKVKKLLDVGCGNGNLVRHFRKNKIKALGIDLKPRRKKSYLFKGDARNLEEYFRSEKFDIITARAVFSTGAQLGVWRIKDGKIMKRNFSSESITNRAYPNSIRILKSCYNRLNSPGLVINFEPHARYLVEKGYVGIFPDITLYDRKMYGKRDVKKIGYKIIKFNKCWAIMKKTKQTEKSLNLAKIEVKGRKCQAMNA